MAYTLEKLRALSDEEIVRGHDRAAGNTSTGVSYFLTELARRDVDRQGERMIALTEEIRILTRSIESMTGTIKALTVANVVLVAISLAVVAIDVLSGPTL